MCRNAAASVGLIASITGDHKCVSVSMCLAKILGGLMLSSEGLCGLIRGGLMLSRKGSGTPQVSVR